MAYDERLARRLLAVVSDEGGVTTRKMFGGLAVMLHGNMLCGVIGDDLMVRVGPEAYDDCLLRPGAKPMDFTGRPMKGMLYVDGSEVVDESDLTEWVDQCRAFVSSLPAKT